MNKLNLTVIVPNYNHGYLLAQAIGMVINQSYLPDEVIIIDDGSTDNSKIVISEIIESNPNINFKFIQNDTNKGIVYTSNLGANEASSEYIYYAAADDHIGQDFFKETITLLKMHPNAGLCSSIVKSIYNNGVVVQMEMPKIKLDPRGQYFDPSKCRELLQRQDSWMGGNSCVYRLDAFLECGGLIPELGSRCDIFLAMLVAVKYGVCYLPRSLSGFTLSPTSYSANTTLEDSLNYNSLMADLMRVRYSKLFPKGYSEAFETRENYRAKVHEILNFDRKKYSTMKGMIGKRYFIDDLIRHILKTIDLIFIINWLFFLYLVEEDIKKVLNKWLYIKLKYLKCRFKNKFKLYF